jgi:hypothetical protein
MGGWTDSRSSAQFGDAFEQFAAIADVGDAEVFQILVRQNQEDRIVDMVLAKENLIVTIHPFVEWDTRGDQPPSVRRRRLCCRRRRRPREASHQVLIGQLGNRDWYLLSERRSRSSAGCGPVPKQPGASKGATTSFTVLAY